MGVAVELAVADEGIVEPGLGRLPQIVGRLGQLVLRVGDPELEGADGVGGDVLLEDGPLDGLVGFGILRVLPLEAPGGGVELEDAGGGPAELLDGGLEEFVHGVAAHLLDDEDVLAGRHEFRELHRGDLGRDGLQRMVLVVLDVVELDAGLDVPRLGAEVELGHVLLELARPGLGHAGDLLGGGVEDPGLLLDAALGVVAHDLDDDRVLFDHVPVDDVAVRVGDRLPHVAAVFLDLVVVVQLHRLRLARHGRDLAEERLAHGGGSEGLPELDVLDLAVGVGDHLVEVALDDLARDGREVLLHVLERVGVGPHDVLREPLHHLVQERAGALEDGAGELVDRVPLGPFERVAPPAAEVVDVRVAEGGGEARALVARVEAGEVGRDDLLEEAHLPRHLARGGGVEDVVERLLVQRGLDVLLRHLRIGVLDDVDAAAVDVEDPVDERLDLHAGAGGHVVED